MAILQAVLNNRTMQQDTAIAVLQSLASAPRLDVYRLLVREGEAGLVAGEIAERLSLPPTNLSFHLKALTHAGLLSVASEGRYQRYRANLPMVVDLITYLSEECCAGQPETCLPVKAAPPRKRGAASRAS